MKTLVQFKTTIPPVVVCMLLVCLTLSPRVQAVVPAPDGGYPNFTTAEGQNALFSLTTGVANTAIGWSSLRSSTTGSYNTATGAATLLGNTGNLNTATGAAALFSNTIGLDNTASGALALFHNTIGNNNTANGAYGLFSNAEGGANTATGDHALFSNTTGDYNTASGLQSLFSNTTGDHNTAIGLNALYSNTTGGGNTAIGGNALFNTTIGGGNTAIGQNAGSNHTAGSNNVYIGATVSGVAEENGACYIASIFGATSANGIAVLINSNHKLGTTTSSKRFKEDIKPMDKASEALLALKPVTFRYKKDIDPAGIAQFGLVAEDVEKANPDLVVRDQEGKPYSVRYDQVNAMLLNEFLKEHRRIEQQQATIRQLESTVAQQRKDFQATVAQLTARLDEQAAQIQKVSAQLEASKPAPQTVMNAPVKQPRH
jgi:hypothetical protein